MGFPVHGMQQFMNLVLGGVCEEFPDTRFGIFEAGLGWVVAWDHDFVGKDALENQKGHESRALIAFTTQGRAIPRNGYAVTTDTGSGLVTSGNFSPTLQHGIGLAYVTPPPGEGEALTVSIRGKDVPGTITELPFIDR